MFWHGALTVDGGDACADMGVRQKLVHADIDEQRIAIAILAVGAGRLHDLGDEMDVVGAVVRQALQAARRLDHAQRLGQHRALAPRPAGEDLEVAPAHLHRFLVAAMEVGEIVACQVAAVLFVIAHDRLGNVAAIEGGARRRETGRSPMLRRRALLVDHVLQRAGEIALHEAVADLGQLAARQEDCRIGRPGAIAVLVLLDHGRHVLEHREAFASVAHGGTRNVAERHRAVVGEGSDPGIGRRRHHGAQDPQRHLAAMLAHEEVGWEAFRPMAETGDGHDLARFLRARAGADHDRRHAGDVHFIGMQHGERDTRGTAGIDGIAAGLEDREARGGREVVTGGDGVPAAVEGRAGGGHDGLSC